MQYTIRGIPAALDAAIRQRARATGKSLVLDLGISKQHREARAADGFVAGRRQLPAVHECLSAIIGVHEARDGNRVVSETAEVVEPDDDVLTCGVDSDCDLRLRSGRIVPGPGRTAWIVDAVLPRAIEVRAPSRDPAPLRWPRQSPSPTSANRARPHAACFAARGVGRGRSRSEPPRMTKRPRFDRCALECSPWPNPRRPQPFRRMFVSDNGAGYIPAPVGVKDPGRPAPPRRGRALRAAASGNE